MIKILEKEKCCGCTACFQRCPKQCISMHEDDEGFLYPIVDETLCINCRLCEFVCPVLNQHNFCMPLEVYATKNIDIEVRKSSSSGGVFPLLIEYIIKKEGVVFGARFNDNYDIIHDSAENIEDAQVFCGSKYVQSYINNSYRKAELFLKQGRLVLFSGTQCQIAGLHSFLRRKYDNLLTVEVVCHGVPSPKIWKEYLSALKIEKQKIRKILFKDKSSGWRGYSFSVIGENKKVLFSEKSEKNKFMIAFYQDLILRPSCYNCPAKGGKSNADITLADYWGIEHINKKFNDNIGISMVCCNSVKGLKTLNMLSKSLNIIVTDFNKSVLYNSSIVKSTIMPVGRQKFWDDYFKDGINVLLSLESNRPNLLRRIIRRIISK